jgi:multidrug efflux pump subunit AcrB
MRDLPDEAEEITVAEFEPTIPVIRLSVYGDVDELSLKRTIRHIRDELRSLPGMGNVTLSGVRDYEIRVDIDSSALIEHAISLPQVTDTISAWMAEVPGGTVRGETGNVKVRTMGVEEQAAAIARIVLRATDDGQSLRVGDIAQINESFVDEQLIMRFNGAPAASVTSQKVGEQDIVNIAEMVRAYVKARNGMPFEPTLLERLDRYTSNRETAYALGLSSPTPLPPGTRVSYDFDYARFVEGRLDLLTRNALQGATLVFITLLLFLNWRAAMWVGAGLVIALCGTMVLMYWSDITLNLLTMFGMIVVLGLLVDDAIVVAENIQTRYEQGEPALTAAINGTEEVFWPVVTTVLTSIVAFLPLMFIKGQIGDLLGALPLVVACALSMSLVESLLILSSHMGHSLAGRARRRERGAREGWTHRFEKWRDGLLFDKVVPAYARLLDMATRRRYVTMMIATAAFIVSIGLVAGERVEYTFLPKSDAETIIADLRMPIGTPIEKTNEIVALIEQAADAEAETLSTAAAIGTRTNIDSGQNEAFATHIAQVFIELRPVEQRDRESSQVIDSIRQSLEGKLFDVDRLNFSEVSGGPAGPDVTVQVRGNDIEAMEQAAGRIKAALATFAGVHDIYDDNELGQREVQFALKPGGAALGFTTSDVARQVRGALYGLDAHVFNQNQEDIDVRVRLDEKTRRSLRDIANLWLISPRGHAVPITEIVEIREGLTYSTIKRVDRKRTISVTATTAAGLSPETVVARLPLDTIRAAFPSVEIVLGGRQEREMEAFSSLPYGFAAAMIMIYVLLAWLFSSYTQPLAVMLAIPFSLVGVIWGHLILGYDITFLSMIGFVALSGIVVNDSLILVEFYNRMREKGKGMHDALIAAGKQRFRPILLTTLTTVLGLLPLMLERSFQAKFLIPMAIAIAFGLLSATFLILLVLPCVMLIIDDAKSIAYFLWFGRERQAAMQ